MTMMKENKSNITKRKINVESTKALREEQEEEQEKQEEKEKKTRATKNNMK